MTHLLDPTGRCKRCRLHVTEWGERCVAGSLRSVRPCRGPACSCGACGKFDGERSE